jgi:hypothetical protein
MSLALAAILGGIAGLVLVAAAGPLYRSGTPLLVAFGSMGLGAVVGAMAVLAGVAALLLALRRGQPLSAPTIVGIIFGLVAFGVPFQRVWSARGLPAIHDISTDLANPPAFEAVLPFRTGAANGLDVDPAVSEQQRRAYPDVVTLALPRPAGEVFDAAVEAARDMDWELVNADRGRGRLEATASTRWFGFKDDVVVRLSPDGAVTRVDVRSVSRVGRGDLGLNAQRIRDFLERLR